MDTSFLPRIGNKISMEGVAETKFGAKTKGRTWNMARKLKITENDKYTLFLKYGEEN